MISRHPLRFSFLWGAVILSLTLWPSTGGTSPPGEFLCLICGSRGLADFILNFFFFVPWGAGLSLLAGPGWGVVASALLSGFIETSQTFIPGRHPALADLVSNTLGGGFGSLLPLLLPRLRQSFLHRTGAIRVGAVALPVLAFLGTALIGVPVYPGGAYYGQWTRELGGMQAYEGGLRQASVGGYPIPDGFLSQSDAIRDALASGDTVSFSFDSSPPPAEPRHLLGIFNNRHREVLLVRVEGRDLLLTRPMVATLLRLDQPPVRWSGILPGSASRRVDASLWQDRNSLCIRIDGESRCDLAGGVAEGWRFVYRADWAPPWALSIVSWLWAAVLCLPLGAAVNRLAEALVSGAGLGLFGLLASWIGPSLTPHPILLVACIAGVVLGFWFRRKALRRSPGRDLRGSIRR